MNLKLPVIVFLLSVLLHVNLKAQPGCIGFSADFSFTKDTSKAYYPNKIIFTNTSLWTDSTTRYNWNYDDGSFSPAKEEAHNYATRDQFNVCLFAFNLTPLGDTTCRDITCHPVKIEFDTRIITSEFSFTTDSADCQTYTFKSRNPNYDIFQWNLGDPVTYLGNTQTKKYTVPGNYTICLRASFTYDNHTKECADSTCTQITVCKNLSAKNTAANAPITLYPSPFNEYISVNGLPGGKYRLNMYDIYGRAVVAEWIENAAIISTTAVSTGIYFAEITSGWQVVHRVKIIK